MRRKPLFYVFNMILPCLLITLVALLGFYIPSDSGEKVTMGITTLLSMTVFLMLVAENMPATSDVLPLVGMSSRQAIIVFSVTVLAPQGPGESDKPKARWKRGAEGAE